MKNSLEPAILTTDRLRLEALKTEDVGEIFLHYRDPILTQHLGLAPLESREQAQKWVKDRLAHQAQGLSLVFTLKLRDSGQMIGTCAVEGIDLTHHYATLGFSLSPYYWRQGFMREALVRLMGYLFEPDAKHGLSCLQRLQAWVRVENLACIKLMNRLGFVQEGCLRKVFYWHGSYHNLYCFSLLREEQAALSLA